MLSEAEYHRPTNVESACQLLDDIPEAIVVAGGQSLGLLTKEGIITPEVLVDIKQIDDLQGIERSDGELLLGATTTHRTIEQSELVAEEVPVLAEAAEHIADVQIRNAGTIGGVAAYADPTAEYPLVLLALGGTVVSETVDGKTEYDVRDDFFEGYYRSSLDPHELVTEVRIPTLDENEGTGYEKMAYRENDRALVNVVSHVRVEDRVCSEANVTVGSVTDRPYLSTDASDELVGSELTDEDLENAAAAAKADVPVDPDPSVSTEYREDLVESLVEGTLQDARERARGG
ncbi:FAD binding domain-containing protein [Natrinema gelatinilyticum]|uniref:FAD binding domain-containing protein n=1 Tax=Natrinema gelatinilyticum TaxID=2961571 RepID=UPI0020C439F6|nr:xanthine dehydrogenase family protein subunit M [Natrinema gelatinilyticum]